MENIDLNLTCFVSQERAFCGDSDLYNTCDLYDSGPSQRRKRPGVGWRKLQIY